jgi:3-hydroxyacyl-[acyl-carrier-protein] dehydratase
VAPERKKPEAGTGLGIEEILRLIPQRPPVLLVDRVLEVVPRKRIVAQKNVSANEPYFVGHFPDRPIMPGVIVLESVFQAATVLGFVSEPERRKEDGVYLLAMEQVRFRRKIVPSDVMRIEVEVLRIHGPVWKFEAVVTVDGETAITGTFLASFAP